MRLFIGLALAFTLATSLGGCSGSSENGRIDKAFPVTPQGVRDALAFAQEQRSPRVVIFRGWTDRTPLHDPYVNDEGDLCWEPSNAPDRCYALAEIRRLYVEYWGASAGEAVGDAATAVLLSPGLAAYAVIRANQRAEERRRFADREAERAAFAQRFGAVLPRRMWLSDVCRIGAVEPVRLRPDACLGYWVSDRDEVRAAFIDYLMAAGWSRTAAPDDELRFERTGPNGISQNLAIETLVPAPDPTLHNPFEMMALELLNP